MSDTGRKNFTEQAHDKVKPESQKSYLEQANDVVSGAYDRVAAAVQPKNTKSSSQEGVDSLRDKDEGLIAQASGLISSGIESVKNTVGLGSESHRKDFTTMAKEKITPESQKSTLDKTKEKVTDNLDRAAAAVSSDERKPLTQEIFDKGRREKDAQQVRKE